MKIISYDLGTGGVKASLYDEKLGTLAKSFIEYDTYYPAPMLHEQRPEDWWDGVCASTRALLEGARVRAEEVACVALSGHSLVTAPIAASGELLTDRVPIWSDGRAVREARDFFGKVDQKQWYLTTGNGFPSYTYSLFKLMHLKRNEPDVFSKIYKVLGSKDYINYRLTGEIATDHSYASGSGGYDLAAAAQALAYWDAAGIDVRLYPDIKRSHEIVGRVLPEAAAETGLAEGTLVACGGVDNSCMALGALGAADGRAYLSLGSSSWIAVNSGKPVLDFEKSSYVFSHIVEGMYTSAFSIFSGGSSLKWVRDTICSGAHGDAVDFDAMAELAAKSPVGANGVFFNPSLAGGTLQDRSVNIRGAYIGLSLGTLKEDVIRAAFEGIAMNLKFSYEFMRRDTPVMRDLLITGGGSKSPFWIQMFADVFGVNMVKTGMDQDAAAAGAAAIAARAAGLWDDYSGISALHKVQLRCEPDPQRAREYDALAKKFAVVSAALAELGDALA
jgi:xylulokinase